VTEAPIGLGEVNDFASRLIEIRKRLHGTRQEANWWPDQSSQAFDELAEEEKYLGDRQFVRHAWSRIDLFQVACEDYVRATASLCTQKDFPILAYFATTRAAVEAAGRVLWLGTPDIPIKVKDRKPGVRPSARISRYLSMRWESQTDAKLLEQTPEQRKLGKDVRAAMEELAGQYGLTKSKSKKGEVRYFGGQPVPSYTALVGALFPPGDRIYRILAAVAHSAEHGLAEFIARSKEGNQILRAQPGRLLTALSVAGIGYVNGSEPCYRYMGWDFPLEEANELRRLVHEYRDRVSVEWPATAT
jgi:hypothetical protein